MEDFKKNWENYETTVVRQFDLIIVDIFDTLDNRGVNEAKQYIRGLRGGNRFARECPKIKPLSES